MNNLYINRPVDLRDAIIINFPTPSLNKVSDINNLQIRHSCYLKMSDSTDTLPIYQQPPNYSINDPTQQDDPAQTMLSQSESSPRANGRSARKAISMYHEEFCSKRTVYNASIHIMGDAGVGKSSLMWAYKYPGLLIHCQPKQNNECYMKMKGPYPNDMPFLLKISHSVGDAEQEQASRYLLPIPDDIVLLCFAMNDPVSLFNIRDKWYPRMRQMMYSTKVPIILVGTKTDRTDVFPPIDHMERKARKVGREIGAIKFMTCSAKSVYNVKDVFNFALDHIHTKWAAGLAKIYEKNLLPYDFEDEVLREARFPKKGGTARGIFPGNKDLKGNGLLNSKAVSGETNVRKKDQGEQHFTSEKKKKKDNGTCVIT
ncbi:hypothetical protein CORT_0B00920 [Candida orthopsilosis Co 90-125]|uniref:Uncharacterized protein n=1 Tax=Candida orthopsilosis (strain 90-125) TaxID=1136231 RepID=H8WZE4_CANO9|nr:hypothetical protein CORT_0B00920 [Candida orthopsilosis Co 90-125]CCG21812.1 hypothetical protein CORT_0B00920 [Candida orthopsilosis Co 90-125]